MRFLIVTAAVFACAAAAPSGALLASSYSSGILAGAPWAVAQAAPLGLATPLAVGAPTIPAGDIQGAAIDAQVVASDHVRAAVDAARGINDQAAEIQGRAINAAEDHAWQSVNVAQTASAQLDGAAAGVAPIVARQLAGHGAVVAPVAAYSAPAILSAPALAAAPAIVAARALAAAPAIVAAPAISAYGAPAISAYSAPVIAGIAGSQSISTQSLSQTHPVPVAHAPVAYAAHGIAHAW